MPSLMNAGTPGTRSTTPTQTASGQVPLSAEPEFRFYGSTSNSPSYKPYMETATAMFDPMRQASMQSFSAALADKGLLGSTGAQGALNQANNEWVQRIKEWADNRWQNERSFREGQRQYNLGLQSNTQQFLTQAAMRAWELMMSGALQRRSLQGDNEGIEYPADLSLFENLWKQSFIPPNYATGPTGDAKDPDRTFIPADGQTRTVPRYTEPYRKDLSRITEDRIAADADAQLALERERLNFYKQQAAAQEAADETDPWTTIVQSAMGNRQLTPETGQLFPRDLLAAWQADPSIGIDVLTLAKQGDPRAVAVLKVLYPDSWQEKLGQVAASAAPSAPTVGGSPASGYWNTPLADLARVAAPGVMGAAEALDENWGSITDFGRWLTTPKK